MIQNNVAIKNKFVNIKGTLAILDKKDDAIQIKNTKNNVHKNQ